MKAARKLLLSVLALTVIFVVKSAYADQITLGDSCSGSLSISGTVNPSVTGSVSSCQATWEQGSTNTIIGNYSIGSGTNFSISSGTNQISGTIDWTGAATVGGVTTVVGTIDVSSVTGFGGEYSVGGVYQIDLTVTAAGGPSSGEIQVPEPASMALVGTGLSLIGLLGRRRRRQLAR